MMMVETDIAGAGEMQDTVPHTHRKAARARPAATGVCQSRLPGFAQTVLQAPDLAHAQAEQLGGSGTRHPSLYTSLNPRHSVQHLLTQSKRLPLHGVTSSPGH